jgi:hypothetical protein
VLRYLDTGDASLRAEVTAGGAQFERFRDQYRGLATTADERRLADQIDGKYGRFNRLAQELLTTREGQERRYADIVAARRFRGRRCSTASSAARPRPRCC